MLPALLNGQVRQYKGNGRRLGYPTANINVETDLADGIYFGFADLADYTHQPALIFVGIPVTMGDATKRVEAHLLDAKDQDYYGLDMRLTVCELRRANQKFENIEQLKQAMAADEAAARVWFARQRRGS